MFVGPSALGQRHNFYRVDEGIFASSTVKVEHVRDLAARGIKTLVVFQGGDIESKWLGWAVPLFQKGETLRERERVRNECEKFGIRYHNPKIGSLSRIRDGDESARNIQIGAALMADPNNYPMVISCGFGIDRCGAVTVAYQSLYRGMRFEDAMAKMHERGHRGLRRLATRSLDVHLNRHVARQQACAKSLTQGNAQDHLGAGLRLTDAQTTAQFR